MDLTIVIVTRMNVDDEQKALTASTTSTRVTFYVTDPSTSRRVPAVVDDPLYRVETGNYDYRVVLRCRQLARTTFAKARNDVMVKLELLEAKHVQVRDNDFFSFFWGGAGIIT